MDGCPTSDTFSSRRALVGRDVYEALGAPTLEVARLLGEALSHRVAVVK